MPTVPSAFCRDLYSCPLLSSYCTSLLSRGTAPSGHSRLLHFCPLLSCELTTSSLTSAGLCTQFPPAHLWTFQTPVLTYQGSHSDLSRQMYSHGHSPPCPLQASGLRSHCATYLMQSQALTCSVPALGGTCTHSTTSHFCPMETSTLMSTLHCPGM